MNYFYHNSIKQYTIGLLDMFNDLKIPRFNTAGARISDLDIPIKFGNREKAYTLNDHDIENLSNGNVTVLPRMVLEFNGLSKAMDRNTNKNHKINKNSLQDNLLFAYHYNAVAYDFNYTLYLATRTFTDATIVIEQIAPMFRPDITLRIQELDIQLEPTAIPVMIGEFEIQLPEITNDDIRLIEVSLPITLKGNLYLPIKEEKIINEIQLNIKKVESDLYNKTEEYELNESIFSITPKEYYDKEDVNIERGEY